MKKLTIRNAVSKNFTIGQRVTITDPDWVEILGSEEGVIVSAVEKSKTPGSRWYVRTPGTISTGMLMSAYLLKSAEQK